MGRPSPQGQPSAAVHCRPLLRWGPADLAAALPSGPLAILDGLMVGNRRVTLVAWAPSAQAGSLEEACTLAAGVGLPGEAPALLGAAVGSLDWDGAAHFWLPGRAALFDPEANLLWHRGDFPSVGGVAGQAGATQAGRQQAKALWERASFCAAVGAAQRHIAAGELHKVVLSVPFAVPSRADALAVYRRVTAGAATGLRFLLRSAHGRALVGVSPETVVTLTGRRAELHPLAGTRPAGRGMAAELLASTKERAEHTVAVEQARQDMLAVCSPESVAVTSFMAVERHPGLVHLASHLAATLRENVSPVGLVQACFPAGTVSGVPRQPALALIRALEPRPRGLYGGAVGALLPGGDVQLWLTIRSLLLADGMAVVQTGAGIVAESRAEAEWQECLVKARHTLAAVGAEVGTDAVAP